MDEQHPPVIHVHGGIVESVLNPAMLVRKIKSMSALAIVSGGEDGGEAHFYLDESADVETAADRSPTDKRIPLLVGEPTSTTRDMGLVFPGHILDEAKFAQSGLERIDTHGETVPTLASVVFQRVLQIRMC